MLVWNEEEEALKPETDLKAFDNKSCSSLMLLHEDSTRENSDTRIKNKQKRGFILLYGFGFSVLDKEERKKEREENKQIVGCSGLLLLRFAV